MYVLTDREMLPWLPLSSENQVQGRFKDFQGLDLQFSRTVEVTQNYVFAYLHKYGLIHIQQFYAPLIRLQHMVLYKCVFDLIFICFYQFNVPQSSINTLLHNVTFW